eukprot:COSAG01_NODE_8078_length_2930_cov_1.918403_4_plen_365_part_00
MRLPGDEQLQNFIPGEVVEEEGANRGLDEDARAATKIQATMRGRNARREYQVAKPPSKVDDEVPLSARETSTTSAAVGSVVDDTRLSASDGMVPSAYQLDSPAPSRKARKDRMWDTTQIEEVTLSKTELVKRNAELAMERRRAELVEKQEQKEVLFQKLQQERRAVVAEKRKERNRIRARKLKKIAANDAEQEQWKEYMQRKIASEALRKQEIDAVKVATRMEKQELRHQATESEPGVKGSYLDAPLREASKLPGPGAYDRREKPSHRAAKLGNAAGKSALDWSIYRAKQIPGPAEYSPMDSQLFKNKRGAATLCDTADVVALASCLPSVPVALCTGHSAAAGTCSFQLPRCPCAMWVCPIKEG